MFFQITVDRLSLFCSVWATKHTHIFPGFFYNCLLICLPLSVAINNIIVQQSRLGIEWGYFLKQYFCHTWCKHAHKSLMLYRWRFHVQQSSNTSLGHSIIIGFFLLYLLQARRDEIKYSCRSFCLMCTVWHMRKIYLEVTELFLK